MIQQELDRILGEKIRAALKHLDPDLIDSKDISENSYEIAQAFIDEAKMKENTHGM